MNEINLENLTFKIDSPTGEVRIGTLPDQITRKDYTFKGSIKSPFAYFRGKMALFAVAMHSFDKFNMVVEVDRVKMSITFRENNNWADGSATVTGSASLSPEITALGINTTKKYSGVQLSDVLRMNRLLFALPDDCARIVNALRDFKAKIEQHIEAADDKKGNKATVFDQRIQQPHDLKFTLSWPVISGEAKTKFLVEINYDVRDRSIEFWLESVEMHEAIQEQCQALIDGEIAAFKAQDITIVEQ